MHVPISQDELDKLIKLSANGFDPRTIPLTHASGEHGPFAIDSDATGADAAWALAQLAILRAEPLKVGGPIQHTGAREVGGGNPADHLAGLHKCEGCGGAEFMCADPGQHDESDGENSADGYSFPDYGVRLDHQNIQTLLMRSGLVSEYGAAQLAAWLDMQAYVLREPNEEY